MEEMFSLNNDILNAVQSLHPIDKLKDLKNKAEDELKIASGLIKDTDNAKWIPGDLIGNPKLREEINKDIITIDGLLKYFYNRDNDECKNFNKFLLFSNIRELLKNSNIKIGQIEKEAGLQNGYMSRLEKLDNSTDPSAEFLVTASKLLKVSIDSLVSYDFRSLTETELYLLKVIDKFRIDTLSNKLDWQIESADMLNQGLKNEDSIKHPLFETQEVAFEESADGLDFSIITSFNSAAYGPATKIAGDCYNLPLKNYSQIYIMNIEKLATKWFDRPEYSKEIWLVKFDNKKECLVSEKKAPALTEAVELLYKEIGNYVVRPKLKKDTRVILDGFLMDDFTVDDDCKISF